MYPGSHDEQGIPLIRAADISEGHISETPTLKISKNVHHEYRRTALEGGECLLTLVGTPGIAAIVPHSMAGWNVARAVAVLRLKEQKNARFLRYAFSSPDVRNTIRNWCNTTVQPTLNLGDIKKIPISWPPIETRETITRILSGLDDKIDLNRRTNETLEAMARALFRDWFVDFGPTRAKMAGEAPYLAPELWELFPDRLDDEGKPEGWKVCNFDELVSINPKEPLSRNTIAPYLSMSELPTQGCLTEAPIPRPFSGGSKFRNEDTLFARITPCLENGKTALAQNLENNIVGWGSTEFHVLRGKGNVPFSWVYLMARDNEFRANAIRGMTGTSGRQRVASEVLATYKTVTPSGNQIWKAFDHACNPLFEKIIINGAESRTLAQLRDLLLPKFMSGEISIRDAEKMVEDAA
jgi:type I restriction enzyme S subunit